VISSKDEHQVSNVESQPNPSVKRGHRGLVLATCAIVACALLAGAAVALFGLPRGSGLPGWTGVAVTVPYCPADAGGCRVVVVRETAAGPGAGETVVVYQDWSSAHTAHSSLVLPAGTYAVSAEGCAGYKIGNVFVTVRSGFHAEVDLGSNWEMPGFLGRACPGFRSGA
jgi:hypothetical protein